MNWNHLYRRAANVRRLAKPSIGQKKKHTVPLEPLEARRLLAAAVFAVTDSADPGEVINIRGWDFGSAPEVRVSLVESGTVDPTDDEVVIPILTKSGTNITALIPDSFDAGLYQLRVHNTDDNSFSASQWINKPYAHTTEFMSVGQGHAFRLFGTSLATIEDDTTVTFNNLTQSQSPITVNASDLDENHITITTPSGLIAGNTYELVVNNGFGGAWGDSAALETINAQSSTADPFSLNVPWGSEFSSIASNIYNVKTDVRLALKAVGNGVADDRAAIQAAIDAANAAGGGVVYLPAGTYRIPYSMNGATDGLTLKSNVVLRGESVALTTLDMQPAFVDGGSNSKRGIRMTNVSRVGMLDLTYQNLHATNGANISTAGNQNEYVFFKDIEHVNPALADSNEWARVRHLLVDGAVLDGRILTGFNGTQLSHITTYATIRDTHVTWAVGRLGYGLSHSVIEDSVFTRDGDKAYQGGAGDGGWTNGGNGNLIYLNNTFNSIGAPLTSSNDGETILAEYSASGSVAYSGNPTSVNGTTGAITDSSASFNTPLIGANLMGPNIVQIIGGKGAGQWRSITSNTSTTINVDRPWDVTPDSSSIYSVTRWNTNNWLIKGNQLENVTRGIWLYTGSYNTVVSDNTLTNAEGIWIRGNSGYSNRVDIAWDTTVEGNVVRNTNNSLPAYIAVMGQGGTDYYGDILSASGIIFRGNEVQAYALGNNNNSWNNGQNWFEGYGAMLNFNGIQSDTSKQTVGVVFQGNYAKYTEREYRVGTGTSQVVIWDADSDDTGALLADYTTKNQAVFGDQIIVGQSQPSAPPIITTPEPRIFTANNQLAGTTPSTGGIALVSDGENGLGYDFDVGQGSLYVKDNKAGFAPVTLNGDFEIVTRIDGFRHSYDGNTYAGLMIRTDASDPYAPFAAIYASPDNTIGYRFEYRTTANTYASKVTSGTVSYPNVWVKLTRVGNLITGYRSSDGSTWTAVGSVTLSALSSSAPAGLVAVGSLYNRRTTASFRDVTINGTGAAPTIVTAAAANPSPVTGTTAALSVLGNDDLGEANLTYTWATTGTPPAAVTFSQNGTNAAKNTVATFSKAGSYSFQVTVTDPLGQTTTSSVNVTVNQTLTQINVSPATANVTTNGTQQLAASPLDQFGDSMSASITWSISSGSGSVNSSGLFTAPATTGSATVLATSGAVSGSAEMTITAPASTFIEAESGTRGGGAIIESNHAGYTGTGFVNFQTNASWTQWTVNAASAGNFEIDFRHATAGSASRTVQLEVNGVVISGGLTFTPTGGWTSWGHLFKTVALNAGSNTIRITTTGQDAGNLDSLTVTAV